VPYDHTDHAAMAALASHNGMPDLAAALAMEWIGQ
jgi:hypothetical protein